MITRDTVYIVDDDPQVRKMLSALVRSVGLKAEAYASAEEFLKGYVDTPEPPRCLILDVRMPGMGGVGLQKKLAADGINIPSIMISAYADVPMVVEAMSAGAVYFLEKPFSDHVLLEHVRKAIERDAQQRRNAAEWTNISLRLAGLSTREREVMDLVVAGKSAKQIAAEFAISVKTVAKHRARVFNKMRVEGVAELVHLANILNAGSRNRSAP